ncbi:hypothetical protein QF026_008532 [Streptomyces aurantiacus]|nr:hypothetical protein [Streptomyces aurantiacus]
MPTTWAPAAVWSPSPPAPTAPRPTRTPPLTDARCTYTTDWVATKLRWQLTVDDRERAALTGLAAGCGQETVDYETAP